MNTGHPLILASGSAYRRELLTRIAPNFSVKTSNINEKPRTDEKPYDIAVRLAEAKARAIAAEHPDAIVIGSDQVAAHNGNALGKPGDFATAVKQLSACAGDQVQFYTAVHVRCDTGAFAETYVDTTTVHFRVLSPTEIENYLRAEEPWDCAGSFKSEGLGIALFSSIDNKDPSALIGLPLIWLCGALRRAGHDPLFEPVN